LVWLSEIQQRMEWIHPGELKVRYMLREAREREEGK
jgi:hypothetical protein